MFILSQGFTLAISVIESFIRDFTFFLYFLSMELGYYKNFVYFVILNPLSAAAPFFLLISVGFFIEMKEERLLHLSQSQHSIKGQPKAL